MAAAADQGDRLRAIAAIPGHIVAVERIPEDELSALIDRHTRLAARAGRVHVRNPAAFGAHLVEVARRAESVASRLRDVLPSNLAPDPIAAFVAGAWHDGGKIWSGDDYHEIASALEVLDRGREWRLVRDPGTEAEAVLRRAARAIVPAFAIYEQWRPEYVAVADRTPFERAYRRLGDILYPTLHGADLERGLLLPYTVDALVMMYSDMGDLGHIGERATTFDAAFDLRWRDIERRVPIEDPALDVILSGVRARIRDGCLLIDTFLSAGFDAGALERYRSTYA